MKKIFFYSKTLKFTKIPVATSINSVGPKNVCMFKQPKVLIRLQSEFGIVEFNSRYAMRCACYIVHIWSLHFPFTFAQILTVNVHIGKGFTSYFPCTISYAYFYYFRTGSRSRNSKRPRLVAAICYHSVGGATILRFPRPSLSSTPGLHHPPRTTLPLLCTNRPSFTQPSKWHALRPRGSNVGENYVQCRWWIGWYCMLLDACPGVSFTKGLLETIIELTMELIM